MQLACAAYLSSPDEATDPYVSPLLAPDLSALPPAHIMTAKYDALRDDGEQYAKRLARAGVPAAYSLHLGHVHVSMVVTAGMESAREWRQELLTVLRRCTTRLEGATRSWRYRIQLA